jgi:hypothetical protein
VANQSGATATRSPQRKKWNIGGHEYLQDELDFIEKNEFFSLLAEAIDTALAKGVGIVSLVETLQGIDREALDIADPEKAVKEVLESIRDKDPDKLVSDFARLFLRIFAAVPRLVPDAIILALSIPEEDRDGFRRGPMKVVDDDTGFGILRLFFEQNAKAIMDFGLRWWEDVISPLASSSTA